MLSDGPSADPAVVYRQLYDAHASQVLSYLNHRLRDYETAQDVAQDAWINALRGLPGTLAKGDGVGRAWVMKVATYAMIDHLRRVKARPRTQDIDDALAPGSAFPAALLDGETPETVALAAAEHSVQRGEAALLLELLPRAERRLLWLREWRGYTYEQMAIALKTTMPAVKSQLFRARAAQRVIWERLQRRQGTRPSTQERLWTYVAGGRAWALAHPRDCWMWLGCLSNGRPGFAAVTSRPEAPGSGRVPQRCYFVRRLVYALVRSVLPPWANLAPCSAGGRCVNPFHAAVTSKAGNPKSGQARLQLEDPATDAPAAAVRPSSGRGMTENAWPGSDTIRSRREALGISSYVVADEAGVGHSRYWHVEQGHLVLPSTQQRVVDALARLEDRLTIVTIAMPEALCARRLAAGLSRESLARRSGVNADSISLFERGRQQMALHSFRRLQDAFDRLEQERQEGVA